MDISTTVAVSTAAGFVLWAVFVGASRPASLAEYIACMVFIVGASVIVGIAVFGLMLAQP